MVLRRRYQVVLVGEAGAARSHRTLVSEHRSEAAARAAAARERDHLELVRGESARDWCVLVLRDDEVIGEERPRIGGDLSVPGLEGAPVAPEAEEEPVAEGEPEAEEEAVAEEEPPEEEAAEEEAAEEEAEEEPVAEEEPPEEDDVPEGPVPEWVIRSFEEAIERRRARGDASGGAAGVEEEP